MKIFSKVIWFSIVLGVFLLVLRVNKLQNAQTFESDVSYESALPELEAQHFAYDEASSDKLMVISSYAQGSNQRYERLNIEAGKALMQMIYAARDDNVWLVPVSGFRTIDKQHLLFEAQVKRKGSITDAKKVSAPPGYSEHHTGYSIDLTDGDFPSKDITIDFVNTPAYSWLTYRAKDFGFELSFPEDNSQGVSFEPWHWRFVGTPSAIEIFKEARS